MTAESQRFINDYDTSAPEDGDKLVGTDVSTSTVRNFTVASVATKIKSEVVNESPGTTVTIKPLSKIAVTPIEDAINALPLFGVTYDELVIFECSIIDLIGTEIYMLKLPKDSYGVGGTQLTSTDVQLLNAIPYINDTEVFLASSITGAGSQGDNLQTALTNLASSVSTLNETGIVLSKDYGSETGPSAGDFFAWVGEAGDTFETVLDNIIGGTVNYKDNQNIGGTKTFTGNFRNNLTNVDFSNGDYTFTGISGSFLDLRHGLILTGAPVTGLRITWTDDNNTESETMSIKPYEVASGHKSLYFGELVPGGNFADTMILDAGNTVGGEGISVDWTQYDHEFKISATPEDWISIDVGRARKLNEHTVMVELEEMNVGVGIDYNLPVGYRPTKTMHFPIPLQGTAGAMAMIKITSTGVISDNHIDDDNTEQYNIITFPID